MPFQITGRRRHLLVLALYLLLALLTTWPLVTQLGSAIPGDGFDGWQNYWNLWWMRQAWLVEHRTAYFTDMLHHPTGADLRFQTMAPFNGLVFLPVQLAGNIFLAYNAAVLFSFVAGGYGAYLLALYAMGGGGSSSQVGAGDGGKLAPRAGLDAAAFVAGVVYAFSPYHFAHLLGHLQLISLQWIPFYVLYLLRGLDRSRSSVARSYASDILKAGFFLILVGLCDWYYVMYCLLFTALALVVYLIQRRLSWRGVGLVAGAAAVFLAVLSPIWAPMVVGASSWTGTSLLRDYTETLTLSADLLAFVTPQVFHPVWGEWAAARSAAFNATASEFTVFAGFAVLALAAIAYLTIRKASLRGPVTGDSPSYHPLLLWLAAVVTFGLLALGPVLHVNGRSDLLPGGRQVPLPYALLYELVPFVKLSRSVSRMDVMVMLALGVLAAFGAYGLGRWLAARSPSRARLAAVGIPIAASGLILFEFLPTPYPTSVADTPAWYQQLAANPEQKAVLNLPANWPRPGDLLHQTVHGKPIATGYITRDDPNTLWERAPVIGHYRWLGPDIHTKGFDLTGQGLQVLHDLLGIGWVVLDRYQMPGGQEREITEALTQQIFDANGVLPLYEDERITVYRVLEPGERGPFIVLEPGWSPRQVGETGEVSRELPAGQSASFQVVHPDGGPLSLEMEVAAPEGGSLHLFDAAGREIAGWTTTGQREERVIDLSPAVDNAYVLRYDGTPGAGAVVFGLDVSGR
jgi:hypothetical protein